MFRPIINENTARVVATCQNKILLLWYAITTKSPAMLWHVMSVKVTIAKKIPGLEIRTLNREKM